MKFEAVILGGVVSLVGKGEHLAMFLYMVV